MFHKKYGRQLSVWGIPALYAAAAMGAGLTVPRLESLILPGFVSPMSISSAIAIYSSIATGMLALTGIVFSLTFVMIQFSATAYSPRLVLWIARDPVMSHALGIFTATFLYGVAALAGVDRSGSRQVPFFSVWVELALLLASVGMFIALIHRIGLLQVNRMLVFTGDQGRKMISTTYPLFNSEGAVTGLGDSGVLPRTQTLIHHGGPRSIQAIHVAELVNLAKMSAGLIEIVVAVGDTVVESTPLLHVCSTREPIPEKKLRNGIALGNQRTFEQDPKYAIRLLVDIAIKALSPAINDPTTAVQTLDQIEDLLLRLGQRELEIGRYRDSDGKLRLIVPFPTWDDLLHLAFDEICFYGATSVQVMRRMNALLADLPGAVPKERSPALEFWDTRLKTIIARAFADSEDRFVASKQDRQGLGAPRKHSPVHVAITVSEAVNQKHPSGLES
jgi:uncharacterized membrane protein